MKHCRLTLFFLILCCFGRGYAQEARNPQVRARELQLLQARPLPLQDVRLTGGPLKHAQELDARILLGLEPDRMMAGYRLRAGLEPKAKGYGGWDSVEGRQLTGHIAGHYLSAVSLMFAATGDERFKERADYLVAEMKTVQDKRGTGYLGAIANSQGKDGAEIFEQEVAQGNIRSSGFDLNGMWSPWYTLHKTFAGLRDAYRYTGNATALQLEIKFAAWAESVLSKLTDQQIQQMLNTEFGGMNEVCVDLYADTGDARWLQLSYKFEHRSFIEPLQRHQDDLSGKHANTQVPKIIGSADRFAYTGRAADIMAASFFWDCVVQHHTFATGGHGKDEYFHDPDRLSAIVDGRTCETCNVYNMLKLTRRLFAIDPDPHYADFQERALFNHILASQDPNEGWACYMVPVGHSVQHEYERNMLDGGFTCCTGTSLESHALHGDGLYDEAGDMLYVNLYASSRAQWKSHGVVLTMDSDFPLGDSATLTVSLEAPQAFTLALRRPYWTGDGFNVKINGQAVPAEALADPEVPALGRQGARDRDRQAHSYYVKLTRTWQTGDTIEVSLPKSLRLEPMPDNPQQVALLWGPLVLAGDLGPERNRRAQNQQERVPVFVAADQPVADWLKPIADQPGHFKTAHVGQPRDVEFMPFYKLHRRTYGIYWDLFTPDQWQAKQAEYAAEQERQQHLEAATVAYVQPGEMQPERNFNFQTGDERAWPLRTEGRPGRMARSWLSFDLPVEADHPMSLIVTYCSVERRRDTAKFDVLIDGRKIADQDVGRAEPLRFYEVEYPIPAAQVHGKDKVTVKFQAREGSSVAGIYGVRMIRSDEAQ